MSLSEASGAEFVKHVTNLEKDIMTTMVSAMGCILSSQSFTDLYPGFVRDHTREFTQKRRKTVDRAYLEVARLEKRLTKVGFISL